MQELTLGSFSFIRTNMKKISNLHQDLDNSGGIYDTYIKGKTETFRNLPNSTDGFVFTPSWRPVFIIFPAVRMIMRQDIHLPHLAFFYLFES
jgi:hypothetical protein